jgi:glycosyltransferase involved in cell wall biosynthesis
MVSIIIPVYNHFRELKKCLESISKQIFRDFEIIVVDDGSKDNFQFSILNFKNNKNFKFIKQNHLGSNPARNRGFKESKGEYLLFCDADIVMKKSCIQKMFDALQKNPQASYAYSSFKFGFKKFALWDFDAEKLKKMPYIHTTSLIRREHFSGFDENIKRLQDWDLWLTMLAEGHTGKFIPEVLFKIKTGGKISKWLPSFFYKFGWLKSVKDYKKAEEIIKKKHGL